jgi:hypothetical protein
MLVEDFRPCRTDLAAMVLVREDPVRICAKTSAATI